MVRAEVIYVIIVIFNTSKYRFRLMRRFKPGGKADILFFVFNPKANKNNSNHRESVPPLLMAASLLSTTTWYYSRDLSFCQQPLM